MADSQKLDLLLDKMSDLEREKVEFKFRLMTYTAEIKAVDELILNEIKGMTDKQYEGMLKDNIACLDRVAGNTTDKNALKALLHERKLLESKLGYEIPSNNLYNSVMDME